MKSFMEDFMNHKEIYYPDVSVAWVLNFSCKRETHRPQNLKDHCQSGFWQNHTKIFMEEDIPTLDLRILLTSINQIRVQDQRQLTLLENKPPGARVIRNK